MSGYFPMVMNIKDKLCIIVGGGSVAARKVKTLLSKGAVIRVISPDAGTVIKELAEEGEIEWHNKRFEQGDLAGAFICVAATGDRETNEEVRHEASVRRVVTNVADDSYGSDYHVPSFFESGPLLISLSTSGTSPAVSRTLRRMIQAYLGDHFGEALEIISSFREDRVKKEISDPKERVKFWEMAVTPDVLELVREGKITEMTEEIEKRFKSFKG